MANEQIDGLIHATDCVESTAKDSKKAWRAPQLESVSIADLTEFMGNAGSDGAGSPFTLS